MSKSLLDTSTTSLQELLAAGKRLSVPSFQRDYSWKEEHWDDLWQDIIDIRHKSNEVHYLGTIVLKSSDETTCEIIDGQQRIATLTVIAVAIVRKLRRMANDLLGSPQDRERADILGARYIGGKDPTKLVDLSSLTLNEINDPFFQECIINSGTESSAKDVKSNKLLAQCLAYFQRHVDQLDNGQIDGESLAHILDNVIGKRLMFIRISVDDEMNAYTVFETLNARGLELTATDLLKNYLFSITDTETRPSLERKWKIIIDNVGSSQFPEFLRYYLLMKTSKVRTQRLFKTVKSTTKSAGDAIDLLDKLIPYSVTFDAISDHLNAKWSYSRELRTNIRNINIFRTKQMTPAIFAAESAFSPQEFARFLDYLVSFLFRYTVVGGRNTNALEPASSQVAQAIAQGRTTNARAVAAILSEYYVPDEIFMRDFQNLSLAEGLQNRRTIKYILCSLETNLAGKKCDFETDDSTIEHVAPVSETNGGVGRSDLHRSIGNLLLIEERLNKRAGALDFDSKKSIYQNSKYELAKYLGQDERTVWSDRDIIDRSKYMSRIACQIWRSKFDQTDGSEPNC